MRFLQPMKGSRRTQLRKRVIRARLRARLHSSQRIGRRLENQNHQVEDRRTSVVRQTEKADMPLTVYNPQALSRARTQLQLGDWESLAKLEQHELQNNPASTELHLLAAAGHLQKGGPRGYERARSLLLEAIDAGADLESVARILIGSASNTLARLAALTDRPEKKVMSHFRSAIAITTPDADSDLLLQPMATRQLMQLAGMTGCNSIKEKAQNVALQMGFSGVGAQQINREGDRNSLLPNTGKVSKPYLVELTGCPGVGKTTILEHARRFAHGEWWGPIDFTKLRKQLSISPEDLQKEYDALGLEAFYQGAMSEIEASSMRSLQKTMAYKMLDVSCREYCTIQLARRTKAFVLAHDELLLHKSFPVISHSHNKLQSARKYFSTVPAPDCVIIMQDDPKKMAERALSRGREVSSLFGLSRSQVINLYNSWLQIYDVAEQELGARGVEVHRLSVSSSISETAERLHRHLVSKVLECSE